MVLGAVLQRSYLVNKTCLRLSYPSHWPMISLWHCHSLTLQSGFKEIPKPTSSLSKRPQKEDLPSPGLIPLCAIVSQMPLFLKDPSPPDMQSLLPLPSKPTSVCCLRIPSHCSSFSTCCISLPCSDAAKEETNI